MRLLRLIISAAPIVVVLWLACAKTAKHDNGPSLLQTSQTNRGRIDSIYSALSLNGSLMNPTQGPVPVGGRTNSQVMEVVMAHLAQMRYEYNKRLRENPTIKGKLTIRFMIIGTGQVIKADVAQSQLQDDHFEHTITNQILTWVFPAMDKVNDTTTVVYPFVFNH
jgi:hypothetical protein